MVDCRTCAYVAREIYEAPCNTCDGNYSNHSSFQEYGSGGLSLAANDSAGGQAKTKRGLLIALTSCAMGCGKSEVAKVLMYGGFRLVKFAHICKAMTKTFLREAVPSLSPSKIERMVNGNLKDTLIEDLGVTPRHLMQTLGTEWRLAVRPDLWATLTAAKVEKMLEAGHNVVIDDMRFKVELEEVRRLGGFPVRVIRPGIEPINSHPSEGELDNVPMAHIENSGSLRILMGKTLLLLDIIENSAHAA